MKYAHTTEPTPELVVADLLRQLGDAPEACTLFYAPHHDGKALTALLRKKWPNTQIIGCSTCGELSTGRSTIGGVSAAALDKRFINRAATTLARFDDGVATGVRRAVAELESQLGVPLRTLDPQRHVGLLFIDSIHGGEETTHITLGDAAPLLSFVGGSAGDNLAFQNTHVLSGEGTSNNGAALMVLEVNRPFHVVKLCHFKAGGKKATVTKANGRFLQELDGRPAAEVFAEALGCRVDQLGFETLGANPAGLVIDGEAWIRQCAPPFVRDGGMTLGCEVVVGSTFHFLRSNGDLVDHFRHGMNGVAKKLGRIEGALMFDCGLRRLELERRQTLGIYTQAIDFPAAGFWTHGESWLGHMHQTLTAIAFG